LESNSEKNLKKTAFWTRESYSFPCFFKKRREPLRRWLWWWGWRRRPWWAWAWKSYLSWQL